MNDYNRIAKSIEFIKNQYLNQPDLEEMASNIYLSPYHFQRLFTRWAGVSPKKFLQYLSINHAKNILNNNSTLSEAAFETGLSGTGRLHDLFVNIEGMTPAEYKNGGKELHIKYNFCESQFGIYLVASTEKGICNLYFIQDKKSAIDELRSQWYNAKIVKGVNENMRKVINFFQHNHLQNEKIKLHLKGTEFQLKVWEALLKIPEGNLCSYLDIAENICTVKASRAVGSAIRRNPVAYIIPCHRVIKKVGGIGEYRWGQTRKCAMIGWEASRLKI